MTLLDPVLLANGWSIFLAPEFTAIVPNIPAPDPIDDHEAANLIARIKNGETVTEDDFATLRRIDGLYVFLFSGAVARGVLFSLEDYASRQIKARAIISKYDVSEATPATDADSWESYEEWRERGGEGKLAPLGSHGVSPRQRCTAGPKPPSYFNISAFDIPEDYAFCGTAPEGEGVAQKPAAFVIKSATGGKRGYKAAYEELKTCISKLEGYGSDADGMWLSYYPGGAGKFCPPLELALRNPLGNVNWQSFLGTRDPVTIPATHPGFAPGARRNGFATYSSVASSVCADEEVPALPEQDPPSCSGGARRKERPQAASTPAALSDLSDISSDEEIQGPGAEVNAELGRRGFTGDVKKKLFNRIVLKGYPMEKAIEEVTTKKKKKDVEKPAEVETGAANYTDAAFLVQAFPQTLRFNQFMVDDVTKAEKEWKNFARGSWDTKTTVTHVILSVKKYLRDNPVGHMSDILILVQKKAPGVKQYLKTLTVLLGLMKIDFETGEYISRDHDEY